MKQTVYYCVFLLTVGIIIFFYISRLPLNQLKGPMTASTISQPLPTSITKYQQQGSNTLAVLLTDETSNWLSLAHGLKTIGIPFTITTDYQEALRHQVVLVYPFNSNNNLTSQAKKALAEFPQRGTLIGINVATEFGSIFGFNQASITQSHNSIHFKKPFLKGNATQNSTLKIGNSDFTKENVLTNDMYDVNSDIIATYENGQPAIVEKKLPNGRAIAVGLDIGYFLKENHTNTAPRKNNESVLTYDPTINVLLNWLRKLYLESEPNAVTLNLAPYNYRTVVIISHDLDYNRSYPNAKAYASVELDQQVKATYFLQTKYIQDYNDVEFFDESAIRIIKKLEDNGMELASHGVSHSPIFDLFPLGNGREQYPTYQPMVMGLNKTVNGTVLGELRVSKFLIDNTTNRDNNVVSFRSGYLVFPRTLPQALAASGYKYDSSMLGFLVKSYLPFQLTFNSEGVSDVDIFEFPVATDEGETLNKKGQKLSLNDWENLLDNIKEIGGVFVLLIHTNDTSKVDYENQLIQKNRHSAWFDTIAGFGGWWSARNQVQIQVVNKGSKQLLTILAPVNLKGLTIQTPASWHLNSQNLKTKITHIENNFIIDNVTGSLVLEFDSNPLSMH